MPETLAQYTKRTAKRPQSCTWTLDDAEMDTWSTSCDNLFLLSCDTPLAHGMKFCCYCGGQLVEGAPNDD